MISAPSSGSGVHERQVAGDMSQASLSLGGPGGTRGQRIGIDPNHNPASLCRGGIHLTLQEYTNVTILLSEDI